jgi:nuclear protein localization family protein 4
MFENGNMVNRFLNYWRSWGHQRVGYLYGRYEVYDGVPLGVRAIVSAIKLLVLFYSKRHKIVYN